MAWALDSDRPLYAQLVERLKLAVLAGRFPPGGRLPSGATCRGAGVNPNTMSAPSARWRARAGDTQRTAGRTVPRTGR